MSAVKNLGLSLLAAAPSILPGASSRVLTSLVDIAIEGKGKFPGAKVWAGRTLERSGGDVEVAINRIVLRSIAMGGAQGFVTNLGGLLTAAVTLPANLAGVAMVQSRMIAAIAHLRGHDLTDQRVRSAIMMVMLGRTGVNELIAKGKLPSTPMVVATAPAEDPDLEAQVAERVLGSLMGEAGGKQAASFLARRIPVIGGGVGLLTDGYSTRAVARYAREQFISRRPQISR